MPSIFLSPSLQTGNNYYGGGTEAQYMGYVADALEPYLSADNITYTRSKLPNTLANAINTSNAGNYDLHLALHSNAAPEGKEGQFRGIQAYYYPGSAKGRQAAEDLADSLRSIYPDPDLVYTVPTTTIAEVRKTKAPSVLMEIGYHDNASDSSWIKNNIQKIAEYIAKGLTEYFKIPDNGVCTERGAKLSEISGNINTYVSACTASGALNIRSNAGLDSYIVGQIPHNEKALLLDNSMSEWAKIRYNSTEGFSSKKYLCVCKRNADRQVGVVTTGGANLNLRSKPSLSSNIIGRIPDKSTVEIISAEGKWYKVIYMGAMGYVLSDFLTV